MGDAKKREFVLGIVMLAAGIVYLALTSQLPRKQAIDASFVPYLLGAILCVLGVLQLKAARSFVPKDTKKAAGNVDYPTVWKTVGLILVYIALMQFVGFPIMTVVYLVAQFTILTPAERKPNFLVYAVIAVLTSALVYLLFRYAFDMMLPVGFLDI